MDINNEGKSAERELTGLFNDNGTPICIGDKLESKWNYSVIVQKDADGHFTGKLVCDDDHSCENIPYALNKGEGYLVNKSNPAQTMDKAQQLREIHKTILRAIKQTEEFEQSLEGLSSYEETQFITMISEMESVIFNNIMVVQTALDIKYEPIDESEIV